MENSGKQRSNQRLANRIGGFRDKCPGLRPRPGTDNARRSSRNHDSDRYRRADRMMPEDADRIQRAAERPPEIV